MAEQAPVKRKKVTIPMLMEKKKKGEPIVQLAVYDYETAIVADRVGIDILCVSDTGGMVLFGHESTTSVSFEVNPTGMNSVTSTLAPIAALGAVVLGVVAIARAVSLP